MKSYFKQTKKSSCFNVEKLHFFFYYFFFLPPQGKPVSFSKESFHAALNSQSEEKDKESTELLKGTPLPC